MILCWACNLVYRLYKLKSSGKLSNSVLEEGQLTVYSAASFIVWVKRAVNGASCAKGQKYARMLGAPINPALRQDSNE
jgi:hypothetical protein